MPKDKKTLLLLERIDTHRELLADGLERQYNVVTAKTLEEMSTRLADSGKPVDVILLGDVVESTGKQSADSYASIVKDVATRGKPVVVVSNHASKVVQSAARGAGAQYVEKPADFEQIGSALKEALKPGRSAQIG